MKDVLKLPITTIENLPKQQFYDRRITGLLIGISKPTKPRTPYTLHFTDFTHNSASNKSILFNNVNNVDISHFNTFEKQEIITDIQIFDKELNDLNEICPFIDLINYSNVMLLEYGIVISLLVKGKMYLTSLDLKADSIIENSFKLLTLKNIKNDLFVESSYDKMTYIGDSTYQFFNRMILFFNDSMFFKRNVNFRNVIPYELLNYDDDDDDGLSDNEQLTVFTTTTNNHKIKRKLSISSHSNKRINSNSKRDILSGTLDSSDIDDAITSANSSPERQQKQEQKQKVKHTDNNNNNMYQSQQQQQQQQQQNNFTSITKLKNLLQQKEITNVYNFPIFLINCKINNLISPPIMNNNNDVNYIIQQELNSNYHDHNQRHKQHKFKNLLLCIAGVTDKEESIELTILSKDVIKFIFNDNNININNYSINELNNKIHQRLTNMIINQTSYNMVIKLHHKKVNYKGDFIKCFKWCYTDYDEYDINE